MSFSAYAWKATDLVGGDASIDFVNTGSHWSSGEPVDRLGGLGGLIDWAAVAGLVDAAEAAEMKAEAQRRPKEAAALFDRAVALRAALWRLYDAAAHRRAARADDLAALKDWTCRARSCRQLTQTEAGFEETWTTDAPALETPIYEIALAAEALLKDGPLDRLHACGGDDCEWMFLDLSKNASRRWCSMATCGNSAKVRNFRTRKSAAVS